MARTSQHLPAWQGGQGGGGDTGSEEAPWEGGGGATTPAEAVMWGLARAAAEEGAVEAALVGVLERWSPLAAAPSEQVPQLSLPAAPPMRELVVAILARFSSHDLASSPPESLGAPGPWGVGCASPSLAGWLGGGRQGAVFS